MDQTIRAYKEYLHLNQLASKKYIYYMGEYLRNFLASAATHPGRDFETQVQIYEQRKLNSGQYQTWQLELFRSAVTIYKYQFLPDKDDGIFSPQVITPDEQPDSSRELVDVLNIDNVLYNLQEAIRLRHLALSTERAYLAWSRRFLVYCRDKKKSKYPTSIDVKDFLTHLALRMHVSASTQNQAFCALLMLCNEVLNIELEDIANSVRAKKGMRLPVVLSQTEVGQILAHVSSKYSLLLSLIYGTGMRLSEGLRLRVKDVDFNLNTITVRDGKGNKDRTTLLPNSLIDALKKQLQKTKTFHEMDLYHENGAVYLPHALAQKYPNAAKKLVWQWVFPQDQLSVDPRTCSVRRHHLTAKSLQRAFSQALAKSGVQKHASVHSLRHSFATQLLIENIDIRQIQELLGHKNLETTMIYTHVARGIRAPCQSPVDILSPVLSPTKNDSDD